jgi:hypothetical protein
MERSSGRVSITLAGTLNLAIVLVFGLPAGAHGGGGGGGGGGHMSGGGGHFSGSSFHSSSSFHSAMPSFHSSGMSFHSLAPSFHSSAPSFHSSMPSTRSTGMEFHPATMGLPAGSLHNAEIEQRTLEQGELRSSSFAHPTTETEKELAGVQPVHHGGLGSALGGLFGFGKHSRQQAAENMAVEGNRIARHGTTTLEGLEAPPPVGHGLGEAVAPNSARTSVEGAVLPNAVLPHQAEANAEAAAWAARHSGAIPDVAPAGAVHPTTAITPANPVTNVSGTPITAPFNNPANPFGAYNPYLNRYYNPYFNNYLNNSAYFPNNYANPFGYGYSPYAYGYGYNPFGYNPYPYGYGNNPYGFSGFNMLGPLAGLGGYGAMGGFGGYPGYYSGDPYGMGNLGGYGGYPGYYNGYAGNYGGYPGNYGGYPGNYGGYPGYQGNSNYYPLPFSGASPPPGYNYPPYPSSWSNPAAPTVPPGQAPPEVAADAAGTLAAPTRPTILPSEDVMNFATWDKIHHGVLGAALTQNAIAKVTGTDNSAALAALHHGVLTTALVNQALTKEQREKFPYVLNAARAALPVQKEKALESAAAVKAAAHH